MPAAWEMALPMKIPTGKHVASQIPKKVNIVTSAQNQSIDLSIEHGDTLCAIPHRKSSALMQADKKSYMCKSADMRNEQTDQIMSVLKIMMDAIGVETRSELAIRAGLAHTTLTRIDSDKNKKSNSNQQKWVPSAKTWIALSKATGVPVTFLGDKIVSGGDQPSQSYVSQDPLEIKFRNFVRLLGPNERKLLMAILDTLAEKTVFAKRN